MLIKRHFANGTDKPPTHVEVKHTGVSPEQNFSDRMVDQAVKEGWITVDGDTLTMKTDGEPLVYSVTRKPGYFCKSTGEAIPIADRAWFKFRLGNDSGESRPQALAWLAGKGLPADDYDITTAYHCVLDADQHAKFKAVARGGLPAIAAHKLEA